MLRSALLDRVPSVLAAALLVAIVCGDWENVNLVAGRAVAAPPAPAASGSVKLEWMTDYGDAMKRAELGRKMLLVYFYDKQPGEAQRRFERESLTDAQVLQRLQNFMVVRLPTDYEVSVGGERSKLMEHDAFAELNGKPGAAIIDFAHDAEDYHGYVVSILPLSDGKYYRFTPKHLSTLLDLPPGTLTQRTMIFAVRIHPEAPQSTRGRLSSVLTGEAREHSRHQARVRVQGHHNWSHRFQRITGLLPFGLRAQEVVAESWPNEGLVDAAIDCVDSWRQSPGHWGAVVSDQPHYGYDIKRGENGIWYATGLFGNSE